MTLTERKNSFTALGDFLRSFTIDPETELNENPVTAPFYDKLRLQIKLAEESNPWFTRENILFALQSWADALTNENMDLWLEKYSFESVDPKTIAVIMAGNIPLVGFHDFLSVLISGHNALVKLSSKDKHILPLLSEYLFHLNPSFRQKIRFTEEKLENFDAIIATGSDNTSRYFDYYFSKYPNIIRRNRNSVAVLSGEESEEQLHLLGEDIFRYFGLGCRNVSKLFVPEDFDFNRFFGAVYNWNTIINKNKYANNYDYNKAVYLMSLFPILDNGFMMLKEDTGYGSPISVVFYEHYTSIKEVNMRIESNSEKIQCVVASGFMEGEIPFGNTQQPKLWDYADNIDTIDFLLNL